MEVSKGYIQTEIGRLPVDWLVKPIAEICTTSKARISPTASKQNYKCVELEHLSQGTGQLLGYADSNTLKSQKSVFSSGDVLFGKLRPYLRKYLHPNFDGVCTTEIWVLKHASEIDDKWLYYLIQSDRFVEAANQSTGTKMPRAEWKTVSGLLVGVPSTSEEQTAIATALSDADALISSLEKLIAKKRNIKQGAMQQLLQPKEGWEVKRLGEVIKSCQLGGNYPNSEKASNYPLMKMGNIQRGSISLKKIEYVSNGHTPIEEDKLKFGDVLFNTRNTLELVGKVAIWRGEISNAYFNSNLMRIEFNKNYVSSNYFMNYLLNTKNIVSKLRDIAIGTTSVAAIYTRDLVKITIEIPSLAEQARIATILSDMDADINSLEAKLEKYKQIKLGMMQQLLTGKIRLV